MSLEKHYSPSETEPRLQAAWEMQGVYHFDPEAGTPVYAIDTPPPTVSGALHLGHLYSYTHPDIIARFRRMKGDNVFYPMGFDDNGLPTERLVEKRLGQRAAEIGREAFIDNCLAVSESAERDYRALWQRLGLSIDWRYTYRTIDEDSQRMVQLSFIDLYRRGLVYRRQAPAIWCPECQASFAQADLNDLERESEFVTLAFELATGGHLPIATTRPELLPACVAIFVHPSDARYTSLVGQTARTPLFGQNAPILTDPAVDPAKGTGAVMCCTFGDTTDILWWRKHQLPTIQAIDRSGRMTEAAGELAGLTLVEARRRIKALLDEEGLLLARQTTTQSVRVHERCDTPVEYLLAPQWFVRVLDFKPQLIQAGKQIEWFPQTMRTRYLDWIENLNWDWCLSRQRSFGPRFPVWYCQGCGETILAEESQLPVDPSVTSPSHPCPRCGGSETIPDSDVFDTWATSSMSPQIVGRQQREARLYARVFPFALRPQAHEIIRTWTFYTILKSLYHYNTLPWRTVLISGWGIAGEGMGKISKSRGGGPSSPEEMLKKYSADAVRYWAASTGPGKDAIISEEKIQMGSKLATKLWNVARFAERFLSTPGAVPAEPSSSSMDTAEVLTIGKEYSPADRWILSRLQKIIRRTTELLEAYDYASAKSEIETFFWTEVTDNYLEMAKQRLYDPALPTHTGARRTLYRLLLTLIKLLAPFLPFVTEAIYLGLGETGLGNQGSLHRETWPAPDPTLEDEAAEAVGEVLVETATAVRRYKSERNLSLGTELDRLQLAAVTEESGRLQTPQAQGLSAATLAQALAAAVDDIQSITRARQVHVSAAPDPTLETIYRRDGLMIQIGRQDDDTTRAK